MHYYFILLEFLRKENIDKKSPNFVIRILFFDKLCYNFYGENMDNKDVLNKIDILSDKVNTIWRLL